MLVGSRGPSPLATSLTHAVPASRMLLIDALNAAAGDDFIVERELGRGGMGAVFLARDRALERPVAIKVLPPELASQTALRERFLRETRTAAAFSHPHIVPVHAVEERNGLLLFVMGYVDGETLASRVRRLGPMNAADATRLLREVAWALSYAHGRGTVHRDIKPDNILIERATGRALVLDFGIAAAVAGPADAGAAGATRLTRIGEVVGTPQFMSPEQASADQVDGRSDLYSLGATMRTPLALFDSLPKHLRAALDGVRVAISRLESEATALAARETELDTALVEARGSPLPAGSPTALTARHAALFDDLAEARRAAGERRAQLLATAENVRLQLIRVRSGLADRDDVMAELRSAEAPVAAPADARRTLAEGARR
jgi:serine/threonine protein kinase